MGDGIRTKRLPWTDNFDMAQRAIAQAFAIQGRLVLRFSDGQETLFVEDSGDKETRN